MLSVLRKFLWVGLTAFGAARWINLHTAFVRTGLIREQDFSRDLAIAQTLPGAGFVNLTALCGMRLGGVRIAVTGLALVLLPGLLTIIAAMVFVSTNDPWVTRLFHGIVVGAVGMLGAGLARMSRGLRGAFDAALAISTLVLIVVGVPLLVTVLVVGSTGVIRYRWAPDAGG